MKLSCRYIDVGEEDGMKSGIEIEGFAAKPTLMK